MFDWAQLTVLCSLHLHTKTKTSTSSQQSLRKRKELDSVQFSRSIMSNSFRPHGLQHARLPCPSATPGACSNSCPSNRWCHPTISSSVIPVSCPQSLPGSGYFRMSVLHIRWPKFWSFSFSISPSNEYSGLISFRIDWFDLLAVQGTLKSVLQHTM